jgi:nucleotide-binding universal stress UspA family protein
VPLAVGLTWVNETPSQPTDACRDHRVPRGFGREGRTLTDRHSQPGQTGVQPGQTGAQPGQTGAQPDQDRADEAGPILVAVDFAPDSEAALLWACRQAACVGAALVVLHVVHDPPDDPGHYRGGGGDPLRPMEDVAAEMMDQSLARIAKAHPDLVALQDAERVLVEGVPKTRIPEIANAKGARLIVMGSRGRTGLGHLLLGSKAEHVVRVSPQPVTIVKAAVGGNDE